MNLLITLIVGLSTLVGSIIVITTNNSKKIVDFSVSLGFGVIIALIILGIFPESLELIQSKCNSITALIIIILLTILGIIILKILDKFIPDHDAHNKKNLIHVGLITSLALFIHNYLEGMAVYTSLNTSFDFGIMLALGVALHNIPLGMSITSFLYNEGTKKALIYSLFVSLATFIGGLTLIIFNNLIINEFIRGLILSITLGMLVYIIIFELLPHILKSKNKLKSISGIIVGIIIFSISKFL